MPRLKQDIPPIDPNAAARRVCIVHEFGSRADWVAHSAPSDYDRLVLTVAAVGRAASSASPDRLRVELIRAGGTLLHWIELLDREAAQ